MQDSKATTDFSPSISSPSLDSLDRSRFIPGTMLASRYRIIGLAGRGGMGEVYRADDLKLGQPVALKFLPDEFEKDQARLSLFLNEVKLARQIAHPNVCRVYDIGEVDRHHYISMEYVDGENLASLLRQIGRLPKDKAIQIARQLCAGLAAAHDQGILHRDLKPANVMIDSRGRARITDFGLAAFASGAMAGTERAGTPAYMAPEHQAEGKVSVASDVYSLGVVLYELFTGRHPFESPSQAEMARRQRESTPTIPSTVIDDMDPAVERVILRCLESDPENRPSSPLAVSAALPGGDPLAAALAAGETPSPEMVAAAGPSGGLKTWVAVACVAVVVLGTLLTMLLNESYALHNRVTWFKSYEALKENGRQIAANLGYDEPPDTTTGRFNFQVDQLLQLGQSGEGQPGHELLDAPGQPIVYFDYYQATRPLVPLGLDGEITPEDPAMAPGDIRMKLGLDGRLSSFWAMPPLAERPPPEADEFEWARLFEAAGLDIDNFEPDQPTLQPNLMTDTRRAWRGTLPDQLDRPVRIEAGSLHGRPIFFEQIYESSPLWIYGEPATGEDTGPDARADAGPNEPSARGAASGREPVELEAAVTRDQKGAGGVPAQRGAGGAALGGEPEAGGGPDERGAGGAGQRGKGDATTAVAVSEAVVAAAGEDARLSPESGAPSAAEGESENARSSADGGMRASQVGLLVLIGVFVLLIVAGTLFLVLRNLRLGRGDRRGALRLAIFVVVLRLLHWALTGHHVFHLGEAYMLAVAFSGAVALGFVVWTFYIAIEPYIRKLWPQTLVSWNRLLSGRLTDPLVGRDFLIGTTVSLGLTVLAVPLFFFSNIEVLPNLHVDALRGGRFAFGMLFSTTLVSLAAALGLLVIFLVLRIILRRTWIAAIVFGLLYGLYLVLAFLQLATMGGQAIAPSIIVLGFALGAINTAGVVLIITRFGLVAMMGLVLSTMLLDSYPLTLDVSQPFFAASLIGPAACLALIVFCARNALAGRPVFAER